MTGSGSISASVSGGGGEKLVNHLGRLGLQDLGEPLDLEEVLEALLGRFALIALTGKNPEQVPALGLGHRFGAVAGGTAKGSTGSRGRAIATRLRGSGGSCWPRTRSRVSPIGR